MNNFKTDRSDRVMNQIASECQIEIQPMGLRAYAFYGAGLHEFLVDAGVALASDCESGSCGLCKVVDLGAGVSMMLGSLQYRLRAGRIASSAIHLNIKKHPGFNRRFALSLRFPPPQSHGALSVNAGSSPALPYAFGNSAAHGLNYLQDHNQAACKLYRGRNKAFAE
ncbi:2Fe-2S iron-sulfur cluster binding domain-containing protein [Desulfatibacillum aliphaticivorans]|uniref:2Fe-2S iron-sulfur cluster binding domain-containing protein n=1 Tax=Desulfatibacillum aliphaticivorans TaxID=218208 RepID=UPI0004109D9F|nr:2Fe-2S iron-sulfur cluster binding domain-containing protein [Desulfatibacillum aliphaticivorans]